MNMKLKTLITIAFLFLLGKVNAQLTVVTSFKEAQTISISKNKPIFLIIKDFKKFSEYKYVNNPEVKKVLKNFVVLELQDQNSSDYRYLKSLKQSRYGLGGNVLDPLGNVIGIGHIGQLRGTSYTSKTELNLVKEDLIRNSFDLSLLKEDYKAILKNKNINARINLIEKYLNYSLNTSFYRNKKQKNSPLFSDVAGRYSKEFKKEIKRNNTLIKSDQQRLELLFLYKIVVDEKYNRAAKKLQKMHAEAIYESNKSLFYYLSYIANHKANNNLVAKEWFSKLKSQKDFDNYNFLSKKV